jgi:hypothetical protein
VIHSMLLVYDFLVLPYDCGQGASSPPATASVF